MSWHCIGPERLRPPDCYQEYIAALGGLNRYGEPNFRLAWGQTPTDRVQGKDVNGRIGSHIILKHGGIPAWFVEVWKPPECFGTAELWYAMSYDPESGMHTLGEFPYRGLYMPAPFNLYTKRVTGGMLYYDKDMNVCETPRELHIDAMPLAFWVLDLLIPNIKKELDVTQEQRRIALQNRMLSEKQAAMKQAYDAYLDAAPAFGGKAGTHESNREAWMQRLKEKQAGMKLSAQDIKRIMGTGHRVH